MIIDDLKASYKRCRLLPRGNIPQIEKTLVEHNQVLADFEKALLNVRSRDWDELLKLRNLVITDIQMLKQMHGHGQQGKSVYGHVLALQEINHPITKRYNE
jgi:hypothetical protein